MAEIKFPITIDGFKCVEEMAQTVLNYTYKGKTLKEWADSISEPQTNADCIRAMTDEELAEWIHKHDCHTNLYGYDPKEDTLEWLKQEAQDAID